MELHLNFLLKKCTRVNAKESDDAIKCQRHSVSMITMHIPLATKVGTEAGAMMGTGTDAGAVVEPSPGASAGAGAGVGTAPAPDAPSAVLPACLGGCDNHNKNSVVVWLADEITTEVRPISLLHKRAGLQRIFLTRLPHLHLQRLVTKEEKADWLRERCVSRHLPLGRSRRSRRH